MKLLKKPVTQIVILISALLFLFIPWFGQFNTVMYHGHKFRIDYLMHFSLFLSLTLYLLLISQFSSQTKPIRLSFIILLAGLMVSFLIELIQKYIPDRSFNYKDMLSNTLGIMAGLLAYNLLMQRKRKMRSVQSQKP